MSCSTDITRSITRGGLHITETLGKYAVHACRGRASAQTCLRQCTACACTAARRCRGGVQAVTQSMHPTTVSGPSTPIARTPGLRLRLSGVHALPAGCVDERGNAYLWGQRMRQEVTKVTEVADTPEQVHPQRRMLHPRACLCSSLGCLLGPSPTRLKGAERSAWALRRPVLPSINSHVTRTRLAGQGSGKCGKSRAGRPARAGDGHAHLPAESATPTEALCPRPSHPARQVESLADVASLMHKPYIPNPKSRPSHPARQVEGLANVASLDPKP